MNALAWATTDWERTTRATQVRAARDRLLEAWAVRQDVVRKDFYGG